MGAETGRELRWPGAAVKAGRRHGPYAALREGMTAFDPMAFRRKLHAAPELSRAEHATSALVADLLEGWGYEVTRGVGGTGVVASLSNGAGDRSIGLRADMDALPIAESTGAAYASTNPGVMHACGHDGHMTMLLTAGKVLSSLNAGSRFRSCSAIDIWPVSSMRAISDVDFSTPIAMS